MKKQIITLFLAVIALTMLAYQGKAQSKAYIPDANFRSFLNTNFSNCMDMTGDSLIIDSAAIQTYLSCPHQNIADITGLEYFTSLTSLYCYDNQLTTIPDISGMTSLQIFYCYENQLTSLPDISAMIFLQKLYCYDNQLTALPDLSGNLMLTRLYCGYNLLTSLPDFSNNALLEKLECNDNLLSTVPDLSNTSLTHLIAYRNILTSLPDFSALTSLTDFSCDQNQLTSLPDMSNCTALKNIFCFSNKLTSLPDFSNCTALFSLSCNNNYITSLPDFSNNTSLSTFSCDNNLLDFSDARELRILNSLPAMGIFYYDSQRPFGNPADVYLCEGDTMVLSIAAQDSATSYQWYKSGNLLSGATSTTYTIQGVTVGDTGVYTCKSFGTALLTPPMLFAPGISEFVSEPFTVYIGEIPVVSLASFDTICNTDAAYLLSGGSPVGGVYSGSAVDSGYFDPAAAGGGTHLITYTYTDSTGCENSDSKNIFVAVCTGIQELNVSNVNIYPNPSSGVFSIDISGITETVEITIVNMLGQEIYSETITVDNKFNTVIDLEGYPSGIYQFQVLTGKSAINEKVIIKK